MLNKKGLFISLEGIDGAGKSSHIENIKDFFINAGKEVITTREPGGTDFSEKLRNIAINEKTDYITETLIMCAARREHIIQKIIPALNSGKVVISDRFSDATFAYQGGGRNVDWKLLLELEKITQIVDNKLLLPNITFWFNIPAKVAADRLKDARTPDKFESQNLDFFEATIAGYERRIKENPERFIIINANQDREIIKLQILENLKKYE